MALFSMEREGSAIQHRINELSKDPGATEKAGIH